MFEAIIAGIEHPDPAALTNVMSILSRPTEFAAPDVVPALTQITSPSTGQVTLKFWTPERLYSYAEILCSRPGQYEIRTYGYDKGGRLDRLHHILNMALRRQHNGNATWKTGEAV